MSRDLQLVDSADSDGRDLHLLFTAAREMMDGLVGREIGHVVMIGMPARPGIPFVLPALSPEHVQGDTDNHDDIRAEVATILATATVAWVKMHDLAPEPLIKAFAEFFAKPVEERQENARDVIKRARAEAAARKAAESRGRHRARRR